MEGDILRSRNRWTLSISTAWLSVIGTENNYESEARDKGANSLRHQETRTPHGKSTREEGHVAGPFFSVFYLERQHMNYDSVMLNDLT